VWCSLVPLAVFTRGPPLTSLLAHPPPTPTPLYRATRPRNALLQLLLGMPSALQLALVNSVPSRPLTALSVLHFIAKGPVLLGLRPTGTETVRGTVGKRFRFPCCLHVVSCGPRVGGPFPPPPRLCAGVHEHPCPRAARTSAVPRCTCAPPSAVTPPRLHLTPPSPTCTPQVLLEAGRGFVAAGLFSAALTNVPGPEETARVWAAALPSLPPGAPSTDALESALAAGLAFLYDAEDAAHAKNRVVTGVKAGAAAATTAAAAGAAAGAGAGAAAGAAAGATTGATAGSGSPVAAGAAAAAATPAVPGAATPAVPPSVAVAATPAVGATPALDPAAPGGAGSSAAAALPGFAVPAAAAGVRFLSPMERLPNVTVTVLANIVRMIGHHCPAPADLGCATVAAGWCCLVALPHSRWRLLVRLEHAHTCAAVRLSLRCVILSGVPPPPSLCRRRAGSHQLLCWIPCASPAVRT
jgi:hypothetical protein